MADSNRGARRGRVFIVDDNDVVRRVLSGIVRQDESLEYVGEAPRGDAALQVIRTLSPDVICLDLMMPGLDGVAVMEQIRQEETATRVVMITGYATPEVIKKARELGVAGFVIKPFSAAKVLSAIHAALQGPTLK